MTVCPLSNVRLRVFPELAEHNLKRLLNLGLCVTVNSDAPAYFGGYVGENWRAVREALGLIPEPGSGVPFWEGEAPAEP